MANCTELDADSVARIGLMFLDGDSLEEVLLDPYGHPDYDFDRFNACKIALLKIERINPALQAYAILWQRRPDNPVLAVPVVAGSALPVEGYQPTRISPALSSALKGEFGTLTEREAGCCSRYYPVYNSDGEPVGALELLLHARQRNDI